MKPSIVLPYKKNPWQDEELRFCLRSIEKNLSGYGHLFIVGDLMSWVRNVTHIPARDFDNFKQSSICNKLFIASNHPSVSEDFIRWDDDLFLNKPLNASDIKHWHAGDLAEWIKFIKNGAYRDVVFNTSVQFGSQSLPFYDVHAPIWMNKTIIREKMKYIVEQKREHLIKSSYCYLAEVKGEPYPEKDLKIAAPRTEYEIRRLVNDRIFFSTDEKGLNHAMIRTLEKMYPDKSKWEER